MKDFNEILKSEGVYDEDYINKTDRVYQIGGHSTIEFITTESTQKSNKGLRGSGRGILYVNECDAISFDAWMQLSMRTQGKRIIDYNPADEYHWIYDHILDKPDTRFIKSTYLDNLKYLPRRQVEFIESMQDIDPDYWDVFGLGNRGKARELIYSNWKTFRVLPAGDYDTAFGLDFGFASSPTAFVEVNRRERELYLTEHLYRTEMTNADIIAALKELEPTLQLRQLNRPIIADGADVKAIQEIRNAGYNIIAADKSAGSVQAGINQMKSYIVHINESSLNLVKESRNYKFKKTSDGAITKEPVKLFDHLMDAARYVVYTHGTKYWNMTDRRIANIQPRRKRVSTSLFNGYR